MSTYPSRILAESMASVPMSSDAGSSDSASERNPASLQSKRSTKDTFHSGPVAIPELSTTFGTPRKRLPSSTGCAIQGPFTIRSNGSCGQELLDADGRIVAWTTVPWLGQFICDLLTEFTNNESKEI